MIPSRSEFEINKNIDFYLLVFQNINEYSDDFRRQILIAFRKTGLGLNRFAYKYPTLAREIRTLEHKLLNKQRPRYDERYD